MRRRLTSALRGLVRRMRSGPVILMYHRVAEPALDPWDLAVSPERFDEQIGWLARNRTVLPLTAFAEALKQGRLPRDAVAVTFDDGYLDNLRNAQPILARHGAGATLFLTTGTVGQGRAYWWDELGGMILLRRDAIDAGIELGGAPCRLAFARDEDPRRDWRAENEPSTDRERVYLDVWSRLRPLSVEARAEAMDRLRALLGPDNLSADDLPMTAAEVAEMARAGVFEIGGHTVNHPMLSAMDREAQRQEIVLGKAACEALAGRPVPAFAYPYGDLDDKAPGVVREAGFALACTTRSAAVSRREDLFTLPRVQALGWSGRELQAALTAA